MGSQGLRVSGWTSIDSTGNTFPGKDYMNMCFEMSDASSGVKNRTIHEGHE